MPLVPEQKIIYVSSSWESNIMKKLDEAFEELPDFRIVSISFAATASSNVLAAVAIEFV
jgi:hypothetical protein